MNEIARLEFWSILDLLYGFFAAHKRSDVKRRSFEIRTGAVGPKRSASRISREVASSLAVIVLLMIVLVRVLKFCEVLFRIRR